MKRFTLVLLAAFALAAVVPAGLGVSGAAWADEPIAGSSQFAVSHGQPFCTTRAQLQALLDAQVSQAPIGLFSFPGCRYVEDNAIVVIGQDYRGGRYMHMVRARTNGGLFALFGTIEGYTFSAGVYPLPVRSEPVHLNPFY